MAKKNKNKKLIILKNIMNVISAFFVIMRHCLGIIFLLFISFVVFCMVDQVKDCVNTLLTDFSLNYYYFQAFVFWWAIQIWFIARTTFYLVNINVKEKKTAYYVQAWLPRIFGYIIFIIMLFSFLKSGTNEKENLIKAIVINLSLSLLFMFFVCIRRKIWKNTKAIVPNDYTIKCSLGDLIREWPYLLFSYVIFIFFLINFILSRVTIPQILGTPIIIVSALGFWGTLIIIFVQLDKINKIPLTFIVAALLIGFSFFNNNHSARLLPESTNKIKRENIKNGFENWLNNKYNKNDNKKFPVFIIACEGGGIRSAYWTAMYLAKIENLSNKTFHNNIFGFSTVSGGSLGAATYVTLIKAQLEKDFNYDIESTTNNFLQKDFISPVIASLFYSDFIQRFLFSPIKYFDRSRAMEKAWESSFRNVSSKKLDYFNQSFYKIWENDKQYEIPKLFLNSTKVEDGKRVVLSNLKLKDELPDIVDFGEDINYSERLRTSTTVLMSARFPYITPCGRIYEDPKIFFKNSASNIWGHLADGGYFENTGCATLNDILIYLNNSIDKEILNKVDFKVLILTNQVNKVYKVKKINKFLDELSQPIQTIFKTRVARSPYSIHLVENNFQKMGIEVLQVNMDLSGEDVPLGWSLSKKARVQVNNYIEKLFYESNKTSNAENTKRILEILSN